MSFINQKSLLPLFFFCPTSVLRYLHPSKGRPPLGPGKAQTESLPLAEQQSGARMSYDLESPNGRITAICFTATKANEWADFPPP